MKKIVTTLPIKPQSNIKTGLLLTPLLLNVISNLIDGQSILMLNLAHSFNDYTIHKQNFIDILSTKGLEFDKIDSDINNIEKYKKIILDMYQRDIIKKEFTQNWKCGCGKVDVRQDLLQKIHDKKLILERNGEFVCSSCLSPLGLFPTNNLVINCDNITKYKINIFPQFVEDNIKHGLKAFNGASLVVTKNRDTGVSINIDNTKYNIDIDFLLYLTPQLFSEDEIVMVSCNRHAMHTLLTNYINNIYGHKKLSFIEHPYIVSNNQGDSYFNLFNYDSNELIKGGLLSSISWNNIDSKWDEGKFKFICKNYEILNEALKIKRGETDIQEIVENPRNALTDYCLVVNNIQRIKEYNSFNDDRCLE